MMLARTALPDLYRGMNKTEKRRAIELEAMKRTGAIAGWWFEGVTLKLADDTRYTPDFLVQHPDGLLTFEETKGFWREDAQVKIKVAASQYPFRFVALVASKGGWVETDYTHHEAQ